MNLYCIKCIKFLTRQGDAVTTLWRCLSVRPNDVIGTSQIKQPTTYRWNVNKAYQWYTSTAPWRNVVTTLQEYVTTTYQWYVATSSQEFSGYINFLLISKSFVWCIISFKIYMTVSKGAGLIFYFVFSSSCRKQIFFIQVNNFSFG